MISYRKMIFCNILQEKNNYITKVSYYARISYINIRKTLKWIGDDDYLAD